MRSMIEIRRFRKNPALRRGITVIEVLVSIAIVSLLLAITLPALQSVREMSRRANCESNVRQLVHGLMNYHETHQSLPPSRVGSLDPNVLPDLGLTFLFPFLEIPNRQYLIQSGVSHVTLLECPSDGDLSTVQQPVSYAINESPGMGSGSPFNGPFGSTITLSGYDSRTAVKLSQIPDGLSSTAVISEGLVFRAGGTEAAAVQLPARYGFYVTVTPVSATTRQFPLSAAALAERSDQTAASIRDCLNGPRRFIARSNPSITSWGLVQNGPVGYTHWWPPNSPGCGSLNSAPDGEFVGLNNRAASGHTNGVNVAFLDGHVRFVGSQIDVNVWRSLGTRDGSEPISEGMY